MAKFASFNKLYVFTVVAKYLSFSQAGEVLFITQAAVSQQIKSLENIVGFDLFKRLNNKVVLTRDGVKLLKIIDNKFSHIQMGIKKMHKDEAEGVLTVDTLPSFAMKWLIPRLDRFNKLYPDINVYIRAKTELIDFSKEDVDMVIRYGHIPDEKTECVKLMDEDIFLVASPSIITNNKPLEVVNDLKKHTLLYDEIDCIYQVYGVKKEVTWNEFSKLLQIDLSKNRSLTFPQAHLVLQAAITGQGVAIARSALVEDELRANTLIKIFANKTLKSPGYHIVYPKVTSNSIKIQLFTHWLLNEVRGENVEIPENNV